MEIPTGKVTDFRALSARKTGRNPLGGGGVGRLLVLFTTRILPGPKKMVHIQNLDWYPSFSLMTWRGGAGRRWGVSRGRGRIRGHARGAELPAVHRRDAGAFASSFDSAGSTFAAGL